ncbi:MAG: ABC transporter permease [Chloroflexota bacterium]
MKILDIAIKDMTRSFRSAFALMFMFGVPLLMAGMFYFMFGGQGQNDTAFSLPATKVIVANLDQGGPGFEIAKAQFPGGSQANSMGDMILTTLQGESFTDIMEVTTTDSAEAARSAVDKQEAGVAIIIPPDFSEQFSDLAGQATIELYKDPTLTIGPSIVQSVMAQFTDGMSGAKVAVNVAVKQTGSSDPQFIGQVIQQYMAASSNSDQTVSALDTRAPSNTKTPANPISVIIGLILGGMTIFYAFFTGASSAQSILKEDEGGTLPRLFTTPTTQSTILAGKFLAIGLTVIVQMTVLLILGRLIFNIHWGAFLPLAIVTLGSIMAASTFGIFLMSLLKSTKQSGAVFGGVLTVTGMVGMIKIFTMGVSGANWTDTVQLFVPQGWAVRGLLQVMNGAAMPDILLTFLVLVAISIVMFIIGVLRFQKRYA